MCCGKCNNDQEHSWVSIAIIKVYVKSNSWVSCADCEQTQPEGLQEIRLCHTLFLKKNMVVHGSYSSYIVLKSGTSVMSTKYTTAKFLHCSETLAKICIGTTHVSPVDFINLCLKASQREVLDPAPNCHASLEIYSSIIGKGRDCHK